MFVGTWLKYILLYLLSCYFWCILHCIIRLCEFFSFVSALPVSFENYLSPLLTGLCVVCAGATEGWRTDSLPRQEEVLRRVQMSQMQAEVDERKQLGQHGTGVHQVPHQRVSTQAGKENFMLAKTWFKLSCCQSSLDVTT